VTDRLGSERELVIARLRARLGDRFAEEDIANAVNAAFDDLIAHAKVQACLPVLAERSASARLADAHQASATVELRGAAEPPLGFVRNPQTAPRAFSRLPGTLEP
jgi:hypothetical protein